MAKTDNKKNAVQVRRLLRSESRWLQKALFALSKLEDEHTKLADVDSDAAEPLTVTIDGVEHDIDVVTEALREAVNERVEDLRAAMRRDHALTR